MNWANVLTYTRLWGIIPLLALALMEYWDAFFVVYVLVALTDAFDGLVARSTGVASTQGELLDGAIDMIFIGFSLYFLYLVAPSIYSDYWFAFVLVGLAYIAFFVISQLKIHRPSTPHLWSGKVSMTLGAALLPFTLIFGVVSWYVYLAAAVTVVARIDVIVHILRNSTSKRSGFF